ncbi:hypothetical protein KBP30_35090 [Streptomyces sp. Go40/10]|uniref:hypothetical protein n=1 Tax=Streptomyces sp. Go40/10 TaxID=2825844 RepID=UPI001E4AA3A1|nr:hypothetical protein [Streptomyces sp. Go40/10]UFR06085.1 hypothetical protein KBP30_35090 [Streptomyces sp. Go40/10]
MRTLLVAAAAFALITAGASAGTAETAHAAAGRAHASAAWRCARDVCLRVSEVPERRDAHGCNHKVCINVVGNASGYTTSGYYSGSNRFYGHINVWGPGMRVEGKDSAYPGVAGKGRGTGQTCAEGWELDNGRYTSVGLPCEDVS